MVFHILSSNSINCNYKTIRDLLSLLLTIKTFFAWLNFTFYIFGKTNVSIECSGLSLFSWEDEDS